jgi:hypothetical protein
VIFGSETALASSKLE